MRSPFPGMNPFLEQRSVWHDFHEAFLPAVREELVQQVRPDFFIRIDEDYIYRGEPEPTLSPADDEWARLLVKSPT